MRARGTSRRGTQLAENWERRALRQLGLANTADDYEALLPWNLHTPDLASDPSALATRLGPPCLAAWRPTAGHWTAVVESGAGLLALTLPSVMALICLTALQNILLHQKLAHNT
jgi:hypothetical protein